MGIDQVRAYYDERGESEWHRLALPFDGAIEFAIHARVLEARLEPGSRVLDLGGGPGRWTIWLAEHGHRPVLADLSPVQLDLARAAMAPAGVTPEAVVEADARDLSAFPDSSFDAVLALGPFYHLVERSDRDAAAREVARVLRDGGRLFAAVMPRYLEAATAILALGAAGIDVARRALAEGDYDPPAAGAFTRAYLFRSEEVAGFFEGHGFETAAIHASQGFLSTLQEDAAALRERDERAYDALIDLACDTSTDPSLFGTSVHLLYVGTRRGL